MPDKSAFSPRRSRRPARKTFHRQADGKFGKTALIGDYIDVWVIQLFWHPASYREIHSLTHPPFTPEYALARRVQARIDRGGVVLRSCAHPPLVLVAVKTYPRYERDEASLQNDGQSWEFFDA